MHVCIYVYRCKQMYMLCNIESCISKMCEIRSHNFESCRLGLMAETRRFVYDPFDFFIGANMESRRDFKTTTLANKEGGAHTGTLTFPTLGRHSLSWIHSVAKSHCKRVLFSNESDPKRWNPAVADANFVCIVTLQLYLAMGLRLHHASLIFRNRRASIYNKHWATGGTKWDKARNSMAPQNVCHTIIHPCLHLPQSNQAQA